MPIFADLEGPYESLVGIACACWGVLYSQGAQFYEKIAKMPNLVKSVCGKNVMVIYFVHRPR